MFSDLRKAADIRAGIASKSAARATAESAVQPLEDRIESLELACAGLWELLKFKLGCSDEELLAAIQTVDAKDGVLDGKITHSQSTATCPSCGCKLLTLRGSRCAWCGVEITRAPFGA